MLNAYLIGLAGSRRLESWTAAAAAIGEGFALLPPELLRAGKRSTWTQSL